MCVTNTTIRRSQAISLGPVQLSGATQQTRDPPSTSSSISVPSVSKEHVSVFFPPQTQSVHCAQLPQHPVHHEKPRPKRRRKPQKPGKTAKMNDRHFVVHNYHDHAHDPEEHDDSDQDDPGHRRRGGVAVAFPVKLHSVLEQVEADGLAHVVSWQAHGRCFVIHNPKEFVDHVMPRYFRQSKLTSFQRQLNLYGFCRLTRGNDAGGYYHELFLRGKPFLCKKMLRTKVKGTRFKAASSPEQEPDFYSMPPILFAPHGSSDEHSAHGLETPSMCPSSSSSAGGPSSFGSPVDFKVSTSPFHNGCMKSLVTFESSPSRGSSALGPLMFDAAPPSLGQGSLASLLQPKASVPPLLPSSVPTSGLICRPSGAKSENPGMKPYQRSEPAFPSGSLVAQPLPQKTSLQPSLGVGDVEGFLDETVDELFMQEPPCELADFLQDWDPNFDHSFANTLSDDKNLGFMLEKLLENE